MLSFFYLEKAYDTTWGYGILKDIHKLGLRGRLPIFIENFLADRIMQVRVGSSLSDYYDQEQGVPQGGVLSTTFFNIKINDIVKCLGNFTDCSLYVDDFCICYRSKSMATIERQLQQNLNKIKFHFLILSHLSINISWKNGKLHGITASEINFLT